MMVKEIAHAYLLGGADVLTTNTFSAREVLKGRQKDLYPYVIREHINILQKTIVDQSELAVSFGPYGDCYKPEEAPQSLREGTDFWHAAVEPLLSVSGKLDYALAETVNNGEEAIAIAHALKTLHRLTRGKVQGVMSFIPQKDGVRLLSGERIADVIATLHAELGSLPILFGLNCCAAGALEPTLRDVTEDREASRTGAQFRFLYPNASDLDPLQLEQSPENKVSRPPEAIGKTLSELVRQYEKSLPGATAHIFINECCGGTPERTSIIAKEVRVRTPELPVS